MTKKAFIREGSRSDFLFADPNTEGFFSLETGKHCNKALVVYTGLEISKQMLVEKARKNGQMVSDEAALYTLENVVKHKISHIIKHQKDEKGNNIFIKIG